MVCSQQNFFQTFHMRRTENIYLHQLWASEEEHQLQCTQKTPKTQEMASWRKACTLSAASKNVLAQTQFQDL